MRRKAIEKEAGLLTQLLAQRKTPGQGFFEGARGFCCFCRGAGGLSNQEACVNIALDLPPSLQGFHQGHLIGIL